MIAMWLIDYKPLVNRAAEMTRLHRYFEKADLVTALGILSIVSPGIEIFIVND